MTTPRDPEELGTTPVPVEAAISALTTPGAVYLTVADMDRSVDFYRRSVGLLELGRDDRGTALGVGSRELVVLVEERGARPAGGFTGLYHFALLLPHRVHLAEWLAHAVRHRVQLMGLSDHFVSEALYLRDPDGHGVEIYWDRPRDLWQGQVASRLTTLSLDVDGLLSELDGPPPASYESLPGGTVMGHVHLKVASIPETVAFYQRILGFGLMAAFGPSAAFFGAGGYHHHVGTNTWESAGASPPPPGHAALRQATILLPDRTERERVLDRVEREGHAQREGVVDPVIRDPSGNALVLALL